MFLNKEKLLLEVLVLSGVLIYAYLINWYSGNIGLIPIDSFGFLDSGYSITKGHLPIRDFWIFTGLIVDYMEAFFLLIFGNNWNSHIIHASFMNIFAVLVFYFFLNEFKIKKLFIVFYCISFATLCYPVSGTPFAYIHSYIFSLASIMFLILAIKNKSQIINLNLGTGKSTSVLDLIKTFEQVNKVKIKYEFVSRRKGDHGVVVADNSLAKSLLNWEPKRNIYEMCKDGWNWQINNLKDYE